MCMLTYFPPNKQPDRDALLNGTETNQDGHGYAIVVPGIRPRLIVRHSLNADELIDQFMRDREKHSHGPALFHSRFGTSGSGGKFNCHPFYLAQDKHTVVAHNGVLPAFMQPEKDDLRCDTHMAAHDIFPAWFGHLSQKESREDLATAIGAYNKLVILTVDPVYDSSAYIINETSGNWVDGIWYSNHDYLPMSRYQASYGTLLPLEYAEEDCPLCESIDSVDLESMTCDMCNSCMDCYSLVSDCICYPGGAVTDWSWRNDNYVDVWEAETA